MRFVNFGTAFYTAIVSTELAVFTQANLNNLGLSQIMYTYLSKLSRMKIYELKSCLRLRGQKTTRRKEVMVARGLVALGTEVV